VWLVGDEKLAAIGVWAAVGHGDDAALVVLQGVVDFVWELAVGGCKDGLAALPCACGVTWGCSTVVANHGMQKDQQQAGIAGSCS
jgi:hypothetical protein